MEPEEHDKPIPTLGARMKQTLAWNGQTWEIESVTFEVAGAPPPPAGECTMPDGAHGTYACLLVPDKNEYHVHVCNDGKWLDTGQECEPPPPPP
jgi:hypothetical protein